MPSTTRVGGRLALRPCFVGARTTEVQARELVADVLRIGASLAREFAQADLPRVSIAYAISSEHHWIKVSARISSEADTAMPRAFAVLRFNARSSFVGCSTGRSPGFAPLSILST